MKDFGHFTKGWRNFKQGAEEMRVVSYLENFPGL